MQKLLDANVVIRYLTNDDPNKALRFEKLLTSGKLIFILTDVIVAEIVWTLQSHYNISRPIIADKLEILLSSKAIDSNRSIISKALIIYAKLNIDYIDAYLAAYGLENKVKEIVSYDRDLDKISGVSRLEP